MKAFERNAILRKHIRDARNINVRTCCTVNKVTKVLKETGSKFKIEFDENVKKVPSQPETKMSSLNQNSANFDHVFITLWDQTFNLLEKSGQIDPIKKESLKECLMTENLTDNTFFENLFESNLKKSDSFSTDMDSDNETSFYPYCYDDYFSLNSNEDKSKPETLLLKTKFYSSDKKKSAFGMLKKALTHQCAIKAIPSDCSIFTDDEDSRVSVSEKHDSLQKFNNIHSACSSSLTTCESVADISFDENELTQEGGSSSKRGGVLKFSRDQMAYLSKLKTYPRVMSVVKNNTPRHNFNPTFVLGGGGMLMSLSGDRTVNFKKAKSLNATSMHQKSIVNDQFPCDQRSSDLNNTFCYSKLNCVYYCEEGASYSKTDDDLIEDDAINEYGETIVKCFKKMLPVVTDNIEYLGAQRLMLVRRGDQNAGIREYQPPALTQDDMIVAIPLKATYVALIAFESIKILLNLMGGDGTPGFSEFKNYWLNIFENIVSDTNPFHVGNNIDIINKYQNVFNIYHNPKSAQINFEAELYLKNCTLNEKGKEILKTCHEKIESSNLYLSDLPLIRSLSDGSYYDQTKISTGELKKIPSKLDLTTWINSEKVSR
jgi:hypothetical protein